MFSLLFSSSLCGFLFAFLLIFLSFFQSKGHLLLHCLSKSLLNSSLGSRSLGSGSLCLIFLEKSLTLKSLFLLLSPLLSFSCVSDRLQLFLGKLIFLLQFGLHLLFLQSCGSLSGLSFFKLSISLFISSFGCKFLSLQHSLILTQIIGLLSSSPGIFSIGSSLFSSLFSLFIGHLSLVSIFISSYFSLMLRPVFGIRVSLKLCSLGFLFLKPLGSLLSKGSFLVTDDLFVVNLFSDYLCVLSRFLFALLCLFCLKLL